MSLYIITSFCKRNLKKAKYEYDRYVQKLKRLVKLKKRMSEEYVEEKNELEEDQQELKESKHRWEKQIENLQNKLLGLSIPNILTSNELVTWNKAKNFLT